MTEQDQFRKLIERAKSVIPSYTDYKCNSDSQDLSVTLSFRETEVSLMADDIEDFDDVICNFKEKTITFYQKRDQL